MTWKVTHVRALNRTIFAVTVAALLTAITNSPSDAARRAPIRSSYDGTWSVAIYTLRGDCGSIRAALRIIGGRVYSGDSKLSSIRCGWRRGRSPRNFRQGEPVGIWLRSTVE